MSFWKESKEELLLKLQTDPERGLNDEEARLRLKHYGKNTYKVEKKFKTLRLLLSQFNTPLIYMLLFAASLSLYLYDKADAIIIFIILFASVFLTFIQQKGALNAMENLLKIVQIKTTVIRSGEKKEILIEDVVPGDIVELNAGDLIPADCYLLEAKDLYVNESALTGESFYTEKMPGAVPEDVPIGKRTNALFMGTYVVNGTALVLVIATSRKTQFGEISAHLSTKPPENDFERGVRFFGYFLMEITLILIIVIFAFNVYFERPVVESLLFALALAVGMTPQLLPAIISINLAYGAKQMAKKRVIVKKLTSIENFGSMSILCADKTGTLTSGRVELSEALDIAGKPSSKALQYALINAAKQKGYTNPMDTAILKTPHTDLVDYEKVDEIPYDFIRKRLSVCVKRGDAKMIITKGDFQQILSICNQMETPSADLENLNGEELKKCNAKLNKEGYRILGICYKTTDKTAISEQDESEMIFLGFLAFLDPLKENIKETIEELKKLGLSLKIITGDNKLASMHAAKLLDIHEKKIITGDEIRKMDDHALMHRVRHAAIFAEVEPNQKERIVLALRKGGNVVGFLGDGINDVTALHVADVSISVDSAADAAKQIADIVLLEKDLSVLREGVLEGRMTFANTLKYVFMSTSANFGNMFSMAGASLFLSFLPLLPKQILLTNLLTDFPEMSIATDNVDLEVIKSPLRWNIRFIRKFMLIFGLISSIFDYATFGILLLLHTSIDVFRTGWFIESVVSASMIVLVIRTFRPFFTSMPSKYLLAAVIAIVAITFILPFTPLAPKLSFVPLPKNIYFLIVGIVCLYILTVEIAKKLFLKKGLKL